ncbi:MAG: tRNA (adenosine(37)-N6)-threonylcarbamoyltransferase complex dimerization subunit type 1 TsaB [Pseudomonadota bacterium]
MIVLGLHTAGPACVLALIQGQEVIASQSAAMARGQDANLPGLVDALLADAALTLSQVDRFAVVTGPGSFTGIRIGVAFARGLALALQRPCVGVSSLEAALPAGQQGSAIVALPAQRRPPDITYWTQTFRTGVPTGPPLEQSLEALQAFLHERPHIMFGAREALQPHFPSVLIQAAAPSAVRAAIYGAQLDPELHPAEPVYARAPDAALPTKPPPPK